MIYGTYKIKTAHIMKILELNIANLKTSFFNQDFFPTKPQNQ